MSLKIGFICVGNSCRSQMAEGYAKYFVSMSKKNVIIYSAGLNPSDKIHPLAIEVMKEDGIDISNQKPKSLEDIPLNELNFYITLCGEENESCPNIPGLKTIHFGVEDPAKSNDIKIFRKVRDEIKFFVKRLIDED